MSAIKSDFLSIVRRETVAVFTRPLQTALFVLAEKGRGEDGGGGKGVRKEGRGRGLAVDAEEVRSRMAVEEVEEQEGGEPSGRAPP